MEILKQVLKKYWPLFLLSLVAFIVVWPTLMPGYFSHHDDLQVMRIYEMRRCFADYQIPCRWVPDMGYGNGFPLYNYYSALPYYLGALFSFIFGYIGAAKLLFFIPLVLGIISMYYLAKELFEENLAVVSAVLYGLAPYRALDSYVRGAVAESFALSLIPLVFYFSLKLIKEKKKKYFLGLSLSLTGFLITHNIMTLFFMPLFIIWTGYFLYRHKQNLAILLLSVLLAFGISAFFLIPAYAEKGLVQTETLLRGDLDFRANFVTFRQLFLTNFWGYGASVPGNEDTISFQIGWPHWWLIVVSGFYLLYQTAKYRKRNIFFYILLSIYLFSILMTHNKSAFIWEKISILHYAQFPWRFLSVTIFTGSILGVVWLKALHGKKQIWAMVFVIFTTILLNYTFFKPEIFYPNLTDQEKLSGYYFEQQQKAAILDYLPNGVPKPETKAPDKPVFITGSGEIDAFKNHSNFWEFQTEVSEKANIEVPVLNFPNWRVYVDGKKILHTDNNYLKRITFSLEPGTHFIIGKFEDTPIRTFSNFISLISLFLLILFYGKGHKIFR